ncbi:MAG: hypothetical protein DCC59_08760 [Chloroflexi bacterium]|nr:MAG: hypothetical protein DCC59_08760 [Chloroflexota bacterium]
MDRINSQGGKKRNLQSPITILYSLFTIHYSLFSIHYSLFSIHHPPTPTSRQNRSSFFPSPRFER